MASLSASAATAATFETLSARSAALPYAFPTKHNLLRAFAGDEARRWVEAARRRRAARALA